MKQILLITDGCSNVGMDPCAAAAHARAQGLTVNVIGVVDQGEIGERGAEEIRGIAEAGGGMSRIVPTALLSRTVQMMTRQTVVHTVHRMVASELREALGTDDLEQLPPAKREKVVQVIEDLSETAPLQVALLVDTSASMKPKLAAVETAIRDLALSLQAREGKSLLSIFHYPGKSPESPDVELIEGWTGNLAKLDQLFYKINMKGATPTGPAIMKVIQYYLAGSIEDEATSRQAEEPHGEGGLLGDYVI